MSDRKIRIIVEGDDAGGTKLLKNVGKEASGLSQSLSSFGSSMQSVGKGLTAGLTLPIVGIAGAAIGLAADLEQTQVAFTTMLGSASEASDLLADLRDFAATTPFEFPEIKDASRSLLAFGVGADDITDTLRRVGDVSAGVGAPLGEIAELYGKAKVQGRLFAEDINQFQGRGIPILQSLASVLGVSTGEVRKLVEQGKVGFPELEQAFAVMTDNGGQFSGMMDAQSQTLSGLFSTLKDTVGNTLADISTQLITTFDLKGKLSGLTEFLDGIAESISNFAKSNPEMFKFAVAALAVAAAIGPILVGVGMLATAIGAAMPVIAGIGAAFGLLLSPIGLVVAGVGLLAVAIYNDWGGIGTFASAIFTRIADSIKAVPELLGDIRDAMEWIWTGQGNNIDWWWDITDFFVQLGAISQESGDKAAETLFYIGAAASDTLDAIRWIWEGKGDNIDWWGDITHAFVEMGLVSQETGDRAAEALFYMGEAASNTLVAIRDLATGSDLATLQTNVTTAFSDIGTAVRDYFSGDISLGGLAGAIGQGFSDIGAAVSAFFGGQDWGGFLEAIQWDQFISSLTWENFIAALDWAGYIGQLLWDGYVSVLSWEAKVLSLAWTDYISPFLWSAWIATVDWATYITPIAWEAIVATLSDWGTYITSLDWTKIITTVIDWATWIPALSWTATIAILDWGLYIGAVVWSGFITALNWLDATGEKIDWTAFVSSLTWENVIAAFDWATYIVSFTWDSFISKLEWTGAITTLTDWGTYITSINWGNFVIMLLDWATWIPALAWNGFVALLDWTAWLVSLDWGGYVSTVDWSAYIDSAFQWSSYIVSVAWSDWIPAAFSWASYVFSLTWSSFVSKLNWPAISWPGFSDFVPDLAWPAISWPGWAIFIPSFPGWPDIGSMIQDAIGSVTGSGTNAIGTNYFAGGVSLVGETGPELVYMPQGSKVLHSRDTRMALSGAGGGDVQVNIYATVANGIDINSLAYEIADVLRRRGR